METNSQPQGSQITEELDLEITDLPESSEDSNIRHVWLWYTMLRIQRAIHPRSWRLIQTGFTLLVALIAMILLLSSVLHPLPPSSGIAPEQHRLFASSDPIIYVSNPLTI